MTIDWTPPKIDGAPGMTWRKYTTGWEARWQCRTDIARRGFPLKSLRVWLGAQPPSDIDIQIIADRCLRLQQRMLVWSRNGDQEIGPSGPAAFDNTLGSLVRCYQTDPDSSYRKLRYSTRCNYDVLCARIVRDHGAVVLADIKARLVQRWHEQWAEGGRVSNAHSLVAMLRTLFTFGMTLLEDDQCERLSMILHKMRFTNAKPRDVRLTAEQAIEIRARAHAKGKAAIALAQAIQFECMLRQKDVIGEWIPLVERGTSEVVMGGLKWLTGIRWNEIDEGMILRHVTSKRQKVIEVDLRLSPMVIEELSAAYPLFPSVGRGALPASGPVIVCPRTGLPYRSHQFRREWRELATEAGVPKHVKNMDTRAGAISEATDGGADLEHVRHAATHSDIAMTQRYSRNSADKVANVQRIRVEHRNKSGK